MFTSFLVFWMVFVAPLGDVTVRTVVQRFCTGWNTWRHRGILPSREDATKWEEQFLKNSCPQYLPAAPAVETGLFLGIVGTLVTHQLVDALLAKSPFLSITSHAHNKLFITTFCSWRRHQSLFSQKKGSVRSQVLWEILFEEKLEL